MDRFMQWPPSLARLLLLPALFVGFTVHELAHALVAFLLGDSSQLEHRRLSFSPLRHVSWLGLVMFLVFGLGWAKPVALDPSRFRIRNQALGLFLVSIAGVTANVLTAVAVLVGVRATILIVTSLTSALPVEIVQFLLAKNPGFDAQGAAMALSTYMIWVNLLLALFNLLPLPPLDGFHALMSLYIVIRSALRGGREQRDPRQPQRSGDGVGLDSSPARIHFDIALGYHREGQWDEAIARYRQALVHDDRFAEAYYNLGLAYWAKGRTSLASSAFRAAGRARQNVGVQAQSELRLRDLARSGDGEAPLSDALPAPLVPGGLQQVAVVPAIPLDPSAARRVWVRLGLGASGLVILSVAAWVIVTLVTLAAMRS